MFNAFMGEEPAFAESLVASAKVLCLNGLIKEAIPLFKRATVIDPDSYEALIDMQLCQRQGRGDGPRLLPEILSHFKQDEIRFIIRWISENFRNPEFTRDFLALLNERGERARGTEIYPAILLLKSQFLLNQAYLRFLDREYLRKAEESLEEATNLTKGTLASRAWRMRAEVNFLLGSSDLALDYVSNAKREDRNYPYAPLTGAVILWRNGDKDEAMEFVNEGVSIKVRNFAINEVRKEIRDYIAEVIEEMTKKRADRIDLKVDERIWELSSYYYGYCPIHTTLKPYFVLQRSKKGNGWLKVTHYVHGPGAYRIDHR